MASGTEDAEVSEGSTSSARSTTRDTSYFGSSSGKSKPPSGTPKKKDDLEMSTRYAILDNIGEENSFVFDTNKTEEEMEKIVDSYANGTGNNFQFDGNYFKDPTTIENDFMVVKQMTVESPNFYVLYQLIF